MSTRKTQRQASPHDPAELARELQRQRDLEAARRSDELERVRAEAGHGRARADVAEESRLAEMARAEREADARAEAELARMYREFRAAGTRTQIKSEMARSGEARALRLEWLRTRNMRVLVPVMIGFGLWSTTGVQQGAARIMHVGSDSPVWWALWGLEALLIGAVCWIIISRARLDSSGGTLAVQAERIGVGCLTTSILLNLVAAMPFGPGPHPSGWEVVGAMFAHALGPVGAAATAHLIGVIDRSISLADPWHGKDGKPVPRLAEMDLARPVNVRAETAPHDRPHEAPHEIPAEPRTDARTDADAKPRTEESAPVRTPERAERLREPASAAARRPALQSARGRDRARTAARTDTRTTVRTASRADGDAVDRDAIVAELAAEILTAGEAGAKWSPDYPALMARTGRKRRWCEGVVSDARTAVLRSSADDAADDGADDSAPHETPHEGPHGDPHGRSADADGDAPDGPRADGPQEEPVRAPRELALTGADGGGR